MARPQKSRRVCRIPAVDRFTPDPQPDPAAHAFSFPKIRSVFPADCSEPEPVILTIDEYETMRLVDLEGLTHSECARQMNISRTTVTEICESARRKVAEAIVRGRELVIEGGSWELCEGNRADCFLGRCTRAGQSSVSGQPGISGQPSASVSEQDGASGQRTGSGQGTSTGQYSASGQNTQK